MKRLLLLLCMLMGIAAISAFGPKKMYNDGNYYGESQSVYSGEPYYGQAKIVIKNDKIVDFQFRIFDKEKNVEFNKEYIKYFKGNELYIQQGKNDWSGLQKYIEKLHKTQTLKDVDAVSGATWSYNIFKAAIEEAMKKARR